MSRHARAAQAIEEFLRALGYANEGELVGTGQRVAEAWLDELVAGEGKDARQPLREGSLGLGPGPHGPVLLWNLAVATMCPHHLLPSHGYATVGYRPREKAAGLGAIAQAVEIAARRLTLQETLTQTIADVLLEGLEAEGAFCHMRMVHTCFITRGERKDSATVETMAFAGSFAGHDRPLALGLLAGATSEPRS
ncbi:MAG: GTP cyclohydrolase I [Myxococcales bacterium]|nr:GTP cyclohydrolase I [Myxococcales bacterium]